MSRAGRPRGHIPTNRGKPNWLNREPPRTPVALVRELFARIDETGVSMGAFGERCGCSKVSLSRLRHGQRRPSILTLIKLAEAIGYRLELVPVEGENKIDSGL